MSLPRLSTSDLFSVSNPRPVWLITVAHAVNEFYNVALPPILPLLVAHFDITYGEAGALLALYFAVYAIFQLPAGILADRIGQRWLLVGGMLTLAGGTLLAAGAQSFGMLVVAQLIAGIGGSTYHPAGLSLISDLETGKTEGKAMGIHGVGGVAGTALAPALVGGLAAVFDWRLALTAAAGVGVLYGIVFSLLFRDIRQSDLAPDGGKRPEEEPSPAGRRLTVLGSFLDVPRERWVALLFVVNLAISAEVSAVRTFLTSYLVEHGGMSAGLANAMFFVMLVGAGISSLAGGLLSDTVDRPRLGIAIMAIATVALATTGIVPLVPLALFVWFFGLGVILWAAIPTMNAITSQYSDRSFSGSLFGVMLTAGSIGSAGGPLLFGVTAERFGLGLAFPLIAGLSIVAAGAFFGLARA